MTTTGALIQRAEFIFKRYEKYTKEDADKLVKHEDAFAECAADIRADIEILLERVKEAEKEKSKAVVATINAEIRKGKAKLKLRLPELIKVAKKKRKKLAPEVLEARKKTIEDIEAEIETIPDGTALSKRTRKDNLLAQRGPIELKVDFNNMAFEPVDNMDHTEESSKFRQEYETGKKKQDGVLDEISRGVGVLKQIAKDMDGELKKHEELIDAIDDKVDKNTTEIRNANKKLKTMLSEIRSPQKICVDLLLIAVMLGIGAYIAQMLKPQAVSGIKEKVTNSVTTFYKNTTQAAEDKVSNFGHRRLLRDGKGGVFDAYSQAHTHRPRPL